MKKIIKIILVLSCMISIFMFSNDTADESADKSGSIIITITEKIIGRDLTNKEKKIYLDKYDFWVRKSAHFSIYLVLGFLVLSLLKEYTTINKKSIIISIIISLLYAISDEVHQAFVPGRSCELRDVLIDSTGSIFGVGIYYLLNRIRRSKNEQEKTTS